MLRRRAQAVEHQVDLPRDQVGQRRAGALVRDMRDKGLGLDLEQLARQVVRRAIAGRAIVELARVLRGVGNQFLQRVGLHARGIDHHHLRRLGDHGDRDEILLDVVVELLVERRGDGMVRAADEDGVAIRRGLGGDAGAHGAARAATVVDHELLA
ncbi:hypothetical protein D3C81_1469820 [compost metagenome]